MNEMNEQEIRRCPYTGEDCAFPDISCGRCTDSKIDEEGY